MSNCAAINTSWTYLIKTNTICGVKKKKRSLSGRCELVYGYSRSNVHTHYCRHCLHHSSCFNLPNLRHTALKAAWMVVASNLSTGPDRASPELLTSCKHHDLLSSALLWPTLCSAINCLSSQWTLKSLFVSLHVTGTINPLYFCNHMFL